MPGRPSTLLKEIIKIRKTPVEYYVMPFYWWGERQTLIVDVTFMLSGYECIFGRGCQGGFGQRKDHGCCDVGVDLTPEDIDRINQLDLEPEFYPNIKRILETDWFTEHKQPKTRTVDGACIFFNRSLLGCGLHQQALAIDAHPADWKPLACSVLPILLKPVGDGMWELTSWDKQEDGGWGKGDIQNGYWCCEDPTAYKNPIPLYRRYRKELEMLLGGKDVSYLFGYLESREKEKGTQKVLSRTTPVQFKKEFDDNKKQSKK